jgi:hypothetical protein
MREGRKHCSSALAFLGLMGLMTGLAGNAEASINVAYINASGGNVDYLNSYGINVTYLADPVGLTLGSLAGYDAIMIASNSVFSDPTGIGNVAADFADAGHGVVLTEFTFQGVWALGGRIMTAGYSPFTVDPSSSGYGIADSLGTVYDPSSPLLSGVTPSNVTTYYQADVGLDSGATLVADWTSGRHAIGYNTLAGSSVVGLNLFPPTGNGGTPDSDTVVANALYFSLTGGHVTPTPEPSTFLAAGMAGLLGLGYRLRIGRRASV